MKVKPHTFSKRVLDWQHFLVLFRANLFKYPDAEPCDMVTVLLKALTTDETTNNDVRSARTTFELDRALKVLAEKN